MSLLCFRVYQTTKQLKYHGHVQKCITCKMCHVPKCITYEMYRIQNVLRAKYITCNMYHLHYKNVIVKIIKDKVFNVNISTGRLWRTMKRLSVISSNITASLYSYWLYILWHVIIIFMYFYLFYYHYYLFLCV